MIKMLIRDQHSNLIAHEDWPTQAEFCKDGAYIVALIAGQTGAGNAVTFTDL